jgi:hypothetical protein
MANIKKKTRDDNVFTSRFFKYLVMITSKHQL